MEQQRAKAMEAALRLLSVRERSAAELRTRLRDKGFDGSVVEQVVDRLQENGLQNDDRFAERFASEAVGKGKAGRLIQRDLRARGIQPELAATASTASPEEEAERARAVAQRRARTMRDAPPRARVPRLAGLLARKGFDPETCWRIASEVGGEAGDEPPFEVP